MSFQLLSMLFLASIAQGKREWRPILEPPPGSQIINVGVAIGGNMETRQVTVSMPAPSDDDGEPQARRNARLNLNTAVVEAENFDRWMFVDEPSQGNRRRHLEDILRAKIDAAAEEHKLTDPQRAKLRVAGRGDIKRFFDQVEDRRQEFEKDRQSFRTGFAALRRLDPLVKIYREGPFGDFSLFAKTLHKIRDER